MVKYKHWLVSTKQTQAENFFQAYSLQYLTSHIGSIGDHMPHSIKIFKFLREIWKPNVPDRSFEKTRIS